MNARPKGVEALQPAAAPPSVQGIEAALRVLGGKWKLLILWHLAAAPRHYGELRRLMFPVSDKVLTEQLRQLERDGLVSREVQPPPAAKPALPPRTVYSLTEYGQSLYPVLAALCEWGRAHLARARGAGSAGEGRGSGEASPPPASGD
ncbi:MAG: helix-turn-helix transcriptional regulator [Limnochordales bacterium]|nr:helix-turn-helix domain-containing protein [Limnochordales bacterium]